jgi:hypothetical protein
MIHKVNTKLVPNGYVAITLLPFLAFYKSGEVMTERCIRHESIHGRQQAELLIIFFYLQYGLEYLYWRLKGYDHSKAYISISFEKEARENDKNAEYLKKRKRYSWMKYLNKNSRD